MTVLPLYIAGLWILLDQSLKAWVFTTIPCCDQFSNAVPVIPGFLSLLHSVNKGAAWSLLWGAMPLLTILRLTVGAGILVWVMRHLSLPRIQVVAYGLIVGGALGNGIDGLLRGQVVDMLWSHWLSALYRPFFQSEFPVFNIADVGVVGGVGLLVASYLLKPTKQPSRAS